MKATVFILTVVFITMLPACKHEIPGIPAPEPPVVPPGSNLVCFESDILPIFISNCAKSGCHDADSHQEGYVFDSYENIIRDGIIPGDANDSEVYEVLFEDGNDKMPRPPNPDLTAQQKALIGRWINEGARNTTNCGTACDPGQFNYSSTIRPLLGTHCTGCHSGPAPSGNIDLSVYDGVRNVALSGRLLGAITHTPGFQPMPQGGNKLGDCQIQQIRSWIDAGAPNN